jgi:hypothetical protein
MTQFTHLNSIYMNYLTPLQKWRIMDLESLRRACDTEPNYFHFARIIREMEKEKIVESFKHRFNGKKYIFFSSFGERQISNEKNPTSISKDSLIHDMKVSELAQSFFNLNWVDYISLEHELLNKRDFRQTFKIIPDALMGIKVGGKKINIALELELTQKQKQRIREKAKQYIISSKYEYVLYFFSKQSVMNTYMEEIKNTVGEKNLNRFLFVIIPSLTAKETDLTELVVIQDQNKMKLRDVFEAYKRGINAQQ